MKNSIPNPFVNYSLLTLFLVVFVGAVFSLMIKSFGYAAVMPWIIFSVFCMLLFLIARWLVRGITIAQKEDPTTPTRIGSFATPYDAQILVSRLADFGVQANAVGGFVSGFQAEGPGYVDVFVAKQDLEAAKAALNEAEPDVEPA